MAQSYQTHAVSICYYYDSCLRNEYEG